MYAKHLIDKVLITLEVGDSTALFILMEKNGAIHRKGNGNPQDTQLKAASGISRQGHFDAFMMTVEEGLFAHTGVVRMEPIAGIKSQLTIIFTGADGIDYAFRAVYGQDSQGPPAELVQLLVYAVKLTDEWYALQLQEQPEETAQEKKWWKIW